MHAFINKRQTQHVTTLHVKKQRTLARCLQWYFSYTSLWHWIFMCVCFYWHWYCLWSPYV